MKTKVIELIKNSKSVAIYAHINVDSDAMGSSLAMREVLLNLGKEADIYINSSFPNNFKFYGDLSFINKKTCKNKYDLVICLDTATEGRLGKYKFTYKKATKNTLLIDHHHLSSTYFCKTNYVVNASSTAEVLYDLFSLMKVKFTPTICKHLLAGIITDTGKFTHSATAKTFKVTSMLMKFGGFEIEEIANPLLNAMKFEVFDMLKKAYCNMEFYADGKLAVVMFKNSDFKETNTTSDELNIFPDLPLQFENVKFSILASEDDQGYYRVSFRSKGDISARDVAETFGGGGHFNASGCKLFGEFDEVKEQLINSVLETLGWKK